MVYKISKTIATLALGAVLAVTGCASNLSTSMTPAQERGYATVEEAMEILGIKDPKHIINIKEYQMSTVTSGALRRLANKQAANRDNSSIIDPSGKDFFTPNHDELLYEMLPKIDINGDFVISPVEERSVTNEVYDKF